MKLAPHWKGPYRVLAVLGSGGVTGVTYRIDSPLDSDGQEHVVHHDRLRPYTLPWPPGSASSLSAPPQRAFSHREEGLVVDNWDSEVPLDYGSEGGQQTVSRSGRSVRPPGHLRDFVTYR